MKNGFVKYVVPLAFAALAIYYLSVANWLEAALYSSVAIAFPLMWAIRDGKIKSNVKLWSSISWALVIIALLLFLALVRLDGLNS